MLLKILDVGHKQAAQDKNQLVEMIWSLSIFFQIISFLNYANDV